jgi:hypothetical protein
VTILTVSSETPLLNYGQLIYGQFNTNRAVNCFDPADLALENMNAQIHGRGG